MARTIVALDGHDASGKTTLARRLAAVLGGTHVRPFAGAAGAELLALAARDPAATARFGWETIEAAAAGARGDALVFDRHWITVCSLLPASMWEPAAPLPPMALCWAALDSTLARLSGRDEPPEPTDEHARYLTIYEQIGRRFDCLVVRTDQESADQSLARLVAWVERGGA